MQTPNGYFVNGGLYSSFGSPHIAMPSTSISSTNFSGVSAGQVLPVLGIQPATSRAFDVNNVKNTLECDTYEETMRAYNVLHQNGLLSLDPRCSSVSYLAAPNHVKTNSSAQMHIQERSNINMDSRALKQSIQTPFTARRLPSSTNVPYAPPMNNPYYAPPMNNPYYAPPMNNPYYAPPMNVPYYAPPMNVPYCAPASNVPCAFPANVPYAPSMNVAYVPSSTCIPYASSSTMAQSICPSNTVPGGCCPRPMLESTKNSNSETNFDRMFPLTYSTTMNSSQISSQNHNGLSSYVDYNHPMENSSQMDIFKNSMQVHRPVSNGIHFSEQLNSKMYPTKLSSESSVISYHPLSSESSVISYHPLSSESSVISYHPLSSESTTTASSCNSSLSECSGRWSQSYPANNISKPELQNSKYDNESEHTTMNETEAPLKMLSLMVNSVSMTPPPPLIKKPTNNLSYHVASNSSKQDAAVLHNLENNCKIPWQVQQANSIIKTANCAQVSESKTSSVETFSSISSSSSMTSPVLKISENASPSLSCRDSLLENTESLIYSDSSSRTDQSEIIPIQMKDGSIPKISIKDSSATIPSSAGYLEYGLGKTSSEQQNASADLEMDTTIPTIDLDNEEGEYCQELYLDEEAEKMIADFLFLETKMSHGEKEVKFSVSENLYILQTMFQNLPIESLYTTYMACKCNLYWTILELSMLKTNDISKNLMENSQPNVEELTYAAFVSKYSEPLKVLCAAHSLST